MDAGMKEQSMVITSLLNATVSTIKSVVPVDSHIEKPSLLKQELRLLFGVLIGVTGDLNGKLVFSGDTSTFASIGERMYGMPLEGEMLQSFSGELGNMIAGGVSTTLSKNETEVIITTPTILQGSTRISGYRQALELPVNFDRIGYMRTYLLID